MTALEKALRLEARPFADNGEFLEAKHTEGMAVLRVAGLRRQVEARQEGWALEAPAATSNSPSSGRVKLPHRPEAAGAGGS
ncbi:MAG: hypothetical protein ABIL09_01740 [Gemmatimonadota bacterium]